MRELYSIYIIYECVNVKGTKRKIKILNFLKKLMKTLCLFIILVENFFKDEQVISLLKIPI